jgi:hypothetical protein
MLKIFYYPTFLPAQRRLGQLAALVAATAVVFTASWLLHSYQWFWVRGDFPITETDIVFWAVIGTCVLVNSIYEMRATRKAPSTEWSSRKALIRALKVLGMFAFFSALWSYWSSPSFMDWIAVVGTARESGPGSYVKLAIILAVFLFAGVVAQWVMHRLGATTAAPREVRGKPAQRELIPLAWRAPLITAVAALIVAAQRPGAQLSREQSFAKIANKIGTNTLNVADLTRQDRNYYDVLIDAPRPSTGTAFANLGNSSLKEIPPLEITRMEFVHHTGDLLRYELKPSYKGVTYRGAPFWTNKWGMRDKEYSLVPPPNTYRIALLGASYEMASGVRVEDGFEWILEDRLNREGPGAPARRYEIMNFSVGGYDPMQNAIIAERIFKFSPNAVILAIHTLDSSRILDHLVVDVKNSVPIPYPYVRDKIRETGAEPAEWREIRHRLLPIGGDLVRWSFSHIVELCRQHNVPAVALVMPRTSPRPREAEETAAIIADARSAGFSVIDLDGVYGSHPIDSIILSRLDEHPNVLGHRLLADRLFDLLRETDGQALSLGFKSKR